MSIPDLNPLLSGTLVKLRPLEARDYDGLFAVAADPLIWVQHPAKDRYKETVFREFFREALDAQGTLIVSDCNTGEIIGSSRYHGYDANHSEIEIGWTFLARSHWGGIYNRELKHLMLAHAFTFVETVIFLVGPENIRSQRAVEKIGGIRFGTRADGSGYTSIAFRLTEAMFRHSTEEANH